MNESAGRAWGWVAHLRSGGTTAWSAWHETGTPRGRVLPGAQQLELLRRVNEAAGAAGTDRLPAGLVDRILEADAAGRGRPDLPLVGAGTPAYGPRPVDPAELTAHDLVRVASVLLAHDLVAAGTPGSTPPRPRLWRRRYRLIGDPLVTTQARAVLLSGGRPEGGLRPVVVVAAGPFDQLLAHTWTQRCFEHGTRSWPQWLRFWRERDQLPPRLDLVEAVRRGGPRRPLVRVVTDPSALAREVGARRLPATHVPGADQAELARRIAAVTGLLVPAEDRPELMGSLAGRLPATDTPPVLVPERERDWVRARAAGIARDLRRAGYPVVGDLDDLAPRFDAARPPAGRLLDERVLDLAVGMLVDPTWQDARHTTREQVTR